MTLRYAHLAPRKKHEAMALINRAFTVENSPSGDTPSDTHNLYPDKTKVTSLAAVHKNQR